MRVVVHKDKIAFMMSPAGEIGIKAARAAGRVRDRGKANATFDTGLMRNSIISERMPDASPTSITFRIGSDVYYAIYQELGVGPIYAKHAPFLVFKIGNKWVRTYSTRGVPAVRYLTRAIEGTTAYDFR